MKDHTNQNQSDRNEEVRLPWKSELEVKDLIKPIILRRVKIFQTIGFFLLVMAAGFFVWWLFIKPPSGELIVKDMVTAAGGMDKWKDIQDGSFVRTHRLYDENGKIIKESEETFFFKNNKNCRRTRISQRSGFAKQKGDFF